VIGAREYWQQHYADRFQFGCGTEDILAALTRIPPVDRWVDLGCGSESMLWAIGLRARRLTAVDIEPARLTILREFTAAAHSRGVHNTALALCRRTELNAFVVRCASLEVTVALDCLTGDLPGDPALPEGEFELVTQFGLLGLCRDADHFQRCFIAAHRLLIPGGWTAGANWVARNSAGRVELSEQLYQRAAALVGINLYITRRVPSTDPDFPAVLIYLGRKHQ
jgi:SAM-dependent methyltransferase